MANYVFYGCTGLTGIWVDENNPAFSNDESGVLFNKQKTTLIQAPGAIAGAYTVPDSVTTISGTSFYNCGNLTSVMIPYGVTAIGIKAFMSCKSLTSVVIPDSVTTVGESAFYSCRNLVSAKISSGMNTIGRTLFANCVSLKEIEIPESVTHINKEAFYSCTGLTDVNYRGSREQWNAITVLTGNEALSKAQIHYNYGKFAIITQPADQHKKLGETATFTVEATGAVSYQWQRIKSGATTWSNISDATSASYSVKVSDATVIPYRCVVKDAEGNEFITEEVTIILPDPLVTILNTPGNLHVIKNTSISFTVELDSEEGVTYQWQRFKGGSWRNVSYNGNKTNTVTFDAASWAQYPFRCEITDANGTKIYAETYTYTLYEPPIVPNINSQPKDVYLVSGGTATFSVVAQGSSFVDDGSPDTGVTYQWWRSKNNGASWGEYTGTGGKTASISVKVYTGQEYLYMCEVKDGYGNTIKSNVVQPRLITAVKVTEQPTVTVEDGTATISFTATGDVKTYQWQRLKSGTWSDAVGGSYVGYNTNTLQTTVKATWRCRIVDLAGNITYTNEVVFAG